MSINKRIQSKFTQVLLSSTGIRLIRATHHRHYKNIHHSASLALFLDVSDPASHFAIRVLPLIMEKISLPIHVYLVPPAKPDVVNDLSLYRQHKLRDVRMMAAYYGITDWPSSAQLDVTQFLNFYQALIECHEGHQFLEQALPLSRSMWRENLPRDSDTIAAVSDTHIANQLAENAQFQRRLGHYLGGMFYFEGEWFSVLDRLQHLHRRLVSRGHTQQDSLFLTAATAPSVPKVDTNELDFFFSFRSPYSYLAVSQIIDLKKRYELKIRVRPVLPMVMRGVPLPRVKQLYIITDCHREAVSKKIPFAPFCDPLGRGVERCLKIFQFAEQQQRPLEFIKEISQGIWSQGLDVSNDRGLKILLMRAGLNWQQAFDFEANADLLSLTNANGDALNRLGLWGVPSFRLGDVALWGQDRIALLEAIMRHSKLPKTAA